MPDVPVLPAPTPEDTLRAVFEQALARLPISLPPGASSDTLRAALRLDPAVMAELYSQVQAQRALRRPAAPAPEVAPATPARAPEVAPATPARVVAAKPRRMPSVLLFASIVVISGCLGLSSASRNQSMPKLPSSPVTVRPPTTLALYRAAGTDKTAFSSLQQRAAAGDAIAEFAVGTLLDTHLLPHETVQPKNDATAFQWYLRAAVAGYPPAEQNVGFAYQTGHGTTQDAARALTWFHAAAQAGLAAAENAQGLAYLTGAGVPADPAEALVWFQKAAAQGFAPAENNLGAAYENGTGTARNETRAAYWFALAAAQGEPNAANRLGYLFYYGRGVPQNYAQAVKYFAEAANQGIAAQLNLGFCYALGAGVPHNNIAAGEWFLLAQERGDTDAEAGLYAIRPPLAPGQFAAATAAAAAWDAAHPGS
jgi:TPR repeat protein